MLEIELDGKLMEVPEGSTIMDAANMAGTYVPHFCYHKKLSIAANCRMCLVQVEKAPKPLPACATPVTKGMKVWTHSDTAVNAQKGVMEFLLINHPLDCPICDQGGECQLQDLAVGYGSSGSRYEEDKRVVVNKNLGSLISTDMTRCIHCTRCVRFGQEIAGIMELGMIGRGEHSEIITFVGKTVDSELSGNVIDLCPVGALTSKPFRYSARTWELTRRPSVSPHCGLGSNLTVQVKQNRVMRVLPRDNEAVNECWLSDKDRFSYEALNSDRRLPKPMLKKNGSWQEVEWPVALEFVASELKRIKDVHGAAAIGALATPHQTLEELHLLQKLLRGYGSGNVDFRLRRTDFSTDGKLAGVPWLGMNIADIAGLDRVLVVGSTLRKDHPLIAHRLRQATKKKTDLNLLHAADDDLLMRVANKAIVAPALLPQTLAQVVKAAAEIKSVPVPEAVRGAVGSVTAGDAASRIAASLTSGEKAGVFLGNFAEQHPAAGELHALAQALGEILGCSFGFLGAAANSVGGHVAGCLPDGNNAGKNARQMIESPLKAYLLLGVEPELDMHNPRRAVAAMKQAELVVAMSPFQHGATEYAHVLLPIAPFTETAGSFINTDGRVQTFTGVVKPLGETRPAWKVLRVLGNLLGLEGFEHDGADDAQREALHGKSEIINKNNNLSLSIGALTAAYAGIARIAEVPIYAADALARRAPSLQKTRDALPPVATLNRALADQLGLRDGDFVRVTQDGGEVTVAYAIDDKLPANCVRLAAARAETAALGAATAPLTVERVAQTQKVTA
ncbi:MAG: NADH-quinone oxidoreductase subunit NuoG [Betaproteobacteria bacterium]|jgi:NADH-quinone oxidoreductase subunit G|nr:NADH-quinone oxidoreductase subunit NuoG [Betaproteobacteria bacterium]MDH4292986.1 NADH-quinone oxidoreductase subunit NuoG [Betaproteobacteria bacterium]MDH5342172.1 NADH-quinone oxidoreductase subunit NuoG [Betaproteobacteria bacterium]